MYDIRHRYLMSRNYIYREFLILWKKRDFWMIDFFFPPQFTGVFFKVFLTDFFLGILFHSWSRSPSKCFDWFLSWHSFTVEVHEMWSWRFCFRIKIVYFPFLDNYQMQFKCWWLYLTIGVADNKVGRLNYSNFNYSWSHSSSTCFA